MLYKMAEWQGATGLWYCNCVDALATNAGSWYAPARILGISPADFIKLVVGKYGADSVKYFPESGFFSYAWTNQAKMRAFKNDLNKAARAKNFQI